MVCKARKVKVGVLSLGSWFVASDLSAHESLNGTSGTSGTIDL